MISSPCTTTPTSLNWRDLAVSALLFIVKVQYKFVMLALLAVVGCLYLPFLALQHGLEAFSICIDFLNPSYEGNDLY